MTRVRVELGERSYDIEIGEGLLASAGATLKALGAGARAAVVTDTNVGPLYADGVAQSLESAGFAVTVIIIPAGEKSKSVRMLERVWNELVAAELDRNSTVVALGGGVVGDLAGFAAATYMRGVRCVQVPTTLLACVDSSVGGKTGIDLGAGKNLVGAFHQPAAVIVDTATLKTLPERELRSGLAEVIKYGIVLDATFFGWLDNSMDELMALDMGRMAEAIRRSCELKARVTSADERESGLRAILNFGHTVGHALEAAAGYEELLHGEAVSLGMLAACRVGELMGKHSPDPACSRRARTRMVYVWDLLARAGLPVKLGKIDVARVMEIMRRDKKARDGRITMVLPKHIGEVEIVKDVPTDVIEKALEDLRG